MSFIADEETFDNIYEIQLIPVCRWDANVSTVLETILIKSRISENNIASKLAEYYNIKKKCVYSMVYILFRKDLNLQIMKYERIPIAFSFYQHRNSAFDPYYQFVAAAADQEFIRDSSTSTAYRIFLRRCLVHLGVPVFCNIGFNDYQYQVWAKFIGFKYVSNRFECKLYEVLGKKNIPLGLNEGWYHWKMDELFKTGWHRCDRQIGKILLGLNISSIHLEDNSMAFIPKRLSECGLVDNVILDSIDKVTSLNAFKVDDNDDDNNISQLPQSSHDVLAFIKQKEDKLIRDGINNKNINPHIKKFVDDQLQITPPLTDIDEIITKNKYDNDDNNDNLQKATKKGITTTRRRKRKRKRRKRRKRKLSNILLNAMDTSVGEPVLKRRRLNDNDIDIQLPIDTNSTIDIASISCSKTTRKRKRKRKRTKKSRQEMNNPGGIHHMLYLASSNKRRRVSSHYKSCKQRSLASKIGTTTTRIATSLGSQKGTELKPQSSLIKKKVKYSDDCSTIIMDDIMDSIMDDKNIQTSPSIQITHNVAWISTDSRGNKIALDEDGNVINIVNEYPKPFLVPPPLLREKKNELYEYCKESKWLEENNNNSNSNSNEEINEAKNEHEVDSSELICHAIVRSDSNDKDDYLQGLNFENALQCEWVVQVEFCYIRQSTSNGVGSDIDNRNVQSVISNDNFNCINYGPRIFFVQLDF